MSPMTSHDHPLLSGSDDFLFRIMQDYKGVIRHVANRFRHLDPMYDTEDLEQEAFFGVRLACNSWAHARAIQMQFKTYLTWHISRHFQGRFHGDDKVVDLLDEHGTIRVSIPWSKYKKSGRAAAKARGYSVRIRSLLVYYSDATTNGTPDTDHPDTTWHPVHTGDDTVVDIFDPTGTLIVTMPRRNYLRVKDVVDDLHYTVREYSIYDAPPSVPSLSLSPPSAISLPVHDMTASHNQAPSPHASAYVVDVYTSQEVFLTRMSFTRYQRFRTYFEKYGLKLRIHDPRLVPEPLDYHDDPTPVPAHTDSPFMTSVR